MAGKLDRIRDLTKKKASEPLKATAAAPPAGALPDKPAPPPPSSEEVPRPGVDTSSTPTKSEKRWQEHLARLPHGSRFDVTYDAGSMSWTGSLIVPGCPVFTSTAGGVFKLLSRLDRLYRAWLKSEGSGEDKEGEARG